MRKKNTIHLILSNENLPSYRTDSPLSNDLVLPRGKNRYPLHTFYQNLLRSSVDDAVSNCNGHCYLPFEKLVPVENCIF